MGLIRGPEVGCVGFVRKLEITCVGLVWEPEIDCVLRELEVDCVESE